MLFGMKKIWILFIVLSVHVISILLGPSYLVFATWKCQKWVPTALQPYDIDFFSFSADQVFDMSIDKFGKPVTWTSVPHTSNVNASLQLYLAVLDECWKNDRHADIIASDLQDMNTFNSFTWVSIGSGNLWLQNNGVTYYLDWTPVNTEITAAAIYGYLSMNTAIQLLTRVTGTDGSTWTYWVQPEYKMVIPAYQQPDNYKGSISRTVI